MNVRPLATGLAVNRVLFGTGFVVAPERSSRGWISIDGATAGGRVMTRATGARDIAIGLGALRALRSGADARPWFAAQLVSDASDFLATWAERRELPALSVAFALTAAGASTAVAAAYLASGDDSPEPPAPEGGAPR
jgi:hypothetical protein